MNAEGESPRDLGRHHFVMNGHGLGINAMACHYASLQ